MKENLNKAEVLAALVIVALGAGIAVIGGSYPMGSIERMGPGYFPVMLGVALSLIGLALLFEVRHANPLKLAVPFRPLVALTAAVLAFAFLAERAGLVPAICALVILSVLGERPARIRMALAISAVMSLVGVVVFIMGLGVPLSAFWW